MNIKYGMILAAGLGKRMQPLTLKPPKPLLEVSNYTLLERAINLLISHGVQEISINVHYLPSSTKSVPSGVCVLGMFALNPTEGSDK